MGGSGRQRRESRGKQNLRCIVYMYSFPTRNVPQKCTNKKTNNIKYLRKRSFIQSYIAGHQTAQISEYCFTFQKQYTLALETQFRFMTKI